MNKLIIWPYKMGSVSARKLAQELQCKRVFSNGRYHPKDNHIIINWGNSVDSSWYYDNDNFRLLNNTVNVRWASNKLIAFENMADDGVSIPEWTTDIDIVKEWLLEENKVFARTLLNSSGGKGIIILDGTNEIINAPLYTINTKAKYEYRVHVAGGEMIDVQQKKQRREFTNERHGLIRNKANGWVFCREQVSVLDCVIEESIKAVNALGLDFGAVDIGYNSYCNKAYVYEVNTSPGIEGTTLQKYVQYLKRKLTYDV